MTTIWDGYAPYVPPHLEPVREMVRSEARESYRDLMAARPERRRQLSSLLAANNIVLDDSDDGIQVLNDWFRANVEANPEQPERLRSLWYSVGNDVALFLGDTLISRFPYLKWAMFTSGKRNIAGYAYRIIYGEPVDEKYLLALLREGVTDEQLKHGMARVFVGSFVLAAVMAVVPAAFVGHACAGFSTLVGLATGAGWVATALGVNCLFERRSLTVFASTPATAS